LHSAMKSSAVESSFTPSNSTSTISPLAHEQPLVLPQFMHL
jgi:hypothetical protein